MYLLRLDWDKAGNLAAAVPRLMKFGTVRDVDAEGQQIALPRYVILM